jgi:hypothetical protein
MLVASRDPYHSGADAPPSPGVVPRLARAMSVLQVAGTLLAIPVGIGSAYTMYRANFSIDSTCQTLRTNIIAMIDKKIDAGTRRMLVRRDVEGFEKTCGGVDPDAEAAFKTLLAADAPPKAVAPKAEPAAAVVAKQPATDDKWLDAVRTALVAHAPDPVAVDTPDEPVTAVVAPAVARPAPAETHVVSKAPAPATAVVSPAPGAPLVLVAPALPPATAVAAAPAPHADSDHPVPPESIPEVTASAGDNRMSHADQGGRFGWIAHVPLLGRALVR